MHFALFSSKYGTPISPICHPSKFTCWHIPTTMFCVLRRLQFSDLSIIVTTRMQENKTWAQDESNKYKLMNTNASILVYILFFCLHRCLYLPQIFDNTLSLTSFLSLAFSPNNTMRVHIVWKGCRLLVPKNIKFLKTWCFQQVRPDRTCLQNWSDELCKPRSILECACIITFLRQLCILYTYFSVFPLWSFFQLLPTISFFFFHI